MKRILILCTGNSCRSQMAEGYLKTLGPSLEVCSAGTEPAPAVHPLAVRVMHEVGIDISTARPKPVEQFLAGTFDYVITLCDDARESCPVFSGHVRHRLHIGFDDPAMARGTDEAVVGVYRRVRDQIRRELGAFARHELRTGGL